MNGRIELSHVRRQRSEQLKRIGIIGLLGQYLAINRFRLAQPAGAVMGHTRFQPLLCGHWHHVSHICRYADSTFLAKRAASIWGEC